MQVLPECGEWSGVKWSYSLPRQSANMDVSALESLVEFPIDFHGQQLTEKFLLVLTTIATITATLFSFALQDILYFPYVFVPFALLAAIIILPAYSAYTKHELKFLQRPPPKNIQIDLN